MSGTPGAEPHAAPRNSAYAKRGTAHARCNAGRDAAPLAPPPCTHPTVANASCHTGWHERRTLSPGPRQEPHEAMQCSGRTVSTAAPGQRRDEAERRVCAQSGRAAMRTTACTRRHLPTVARCVRACAGPQARRQRARRMRDGTAAARGCQQCLPATMCCLRAAHKLEYNSSAAACRPRVPNVSPAAQRGCALQHPAPQDTIKGQVRIDGPA